MMDLNEAKYGVMVLFGLAQDRGSLRALLNAVMNLRFSQNAENFF